MDRMMRTTVGLVTGLAMFVLLVPLASAEPATGTLLVLGEATFPAGSSGSMGPYALITEGTSHLSDLLLHADSAHVCVYQISFYLTPAGTRQQTPDGLHEDCTSE